jgi:hypothetical protein
MPDKVFTMDLKAGLADRIEALARKIKIPPETFCFFAVVDTLKVLEGLETVAKDEPLRDQLRDLVELRRLKAFDDAEFAREIEELAAVGDRDDDQWTPGGEL